jgi:hypothetical protein
MWGASQKLYKLVNKATPFEHCTDEFKDALRDHVNNYGYGHYFWNRSEHEDHRERVKLIATHADHPDYPELIRLGSLGD